MNQIHKKLIATVAVISLIVFGSLTTVKTSKAVTGNLTGSCGMLLNVSHWGVSMKSNAADNSTNNFLFLINFDSGQITGYASNVTFGTITNGIPTSTGTYTTSAGGIGFSQAKDSVSGFYELTPSDLDRMPVLKVLPVNGGNSFLITAGGTNRSGAGGAGVCQKV